MSMGKVLVGMSGGVDSSTTAAILMDKGYEVYGATLKLWDAPEGAHDYGRTCCSLEDVEDARSSAFKLGIPFYVLNMKDLFKEKVVKYFVNSYIEGETPNPCMACNRHIKFEAMLQKALMLDMDYIATGHYARVEYDTGSNRYLLKKARDKSKDQSYVLYMLTQEQLRRLLLPLGELLKSEVREIARQKGFVNSDKPDSQDICFVQNGSYSDFIRDYTGSDFPEGQFVDSQGRVLGKSKSMIHYTIGQRKGLGVSGNSRLYVVDKDLKRNRVTLGSKEDAYSRKLIADEMNYIAFEKPQEVKRVWAKTRYSQQEVEASLYPLEDDKVMIEFKEPHPFVAPGQSVVLYADDIVLAGGIIRSRET